MASDLETLLPERTVAGFTIRPWSLAQLIQVLPAVERTLARAEALDLDFTTIEAESAGPKMLRLITQSLPDLREVLAITLFGASTMGDTLSPEQILKLDALSLGQIAALVTAVIAANKAELKHFFASLGVEPDVPTRPNPAGTGLGASSAP